VTLTHALSECEPPCPIHAPSDHHMKDRPLNWRPDRYLMERICEHGIGHPDPDHMARVRLLKGDEFADGHGIHGCDGCCHLPDREDAA
jgi:hypothetical protein